MTELYRGRQGYQGRQGVIGYQGAAGRGYQGFQGEPGYGEDGAQGFQGADGVGSQGHQGFQGLTGTGNQGFQGLQGSGGAQGAAGSGSQGAQGFQGSPGTGNQGAQGAQGAGGSGGSGFTYTLVYSNSAGTPTSGQFTDSTNNGLGEISALRFHATTSDGRIMPPLSTYGYGHSSTLTVFDASGSVVGRTSFYSFNLITGTGATAVYAVNGNQIFKTGSFTNGATYTFQFIPNSYLGYSSEIELLPSYTYDPDNLGTYITGGYTLALQTVIGKRTVESIVAGNVGFNGNSNAYGADGNFGAGGAPFDGSTGDPDYFPTHWDGGAGGAPGAGGPPGASGGGGSPGAQGAFTLDINSLTKSVLHLEAHPSQAGNGGQGGQGGVGGVGGDGGAGGNATDGSNGNPGFQGGMGGDGGVGSNGGQGGDGGDVIMVFAGTHNYIAMTIDPADATDGSPGNDGGGGGTGGTGDNGDFGSSPGSIGMQGTPGTGDGPMGSQGGDINVDVDGDHCVLLAKVTAGSYETSNYTVDADHCFHGGYVLPTSYRNFLDRHGSERDLNLHGLGSFGWGSAYTDAAATNAWATHGAKVLNPDQIGHGQKYLTTFRGISFTVAGADIIGQWVSNQSSIVFAKFTLLGIDGGGSNYMKTYSAAYQNNVGSLSAIQNLTLVDDVYGSDPSPTLTFTSQTVKFNITGIINANWTLVVELYEHRY